MTNFIYNELRFKSIKDCKQIAQLMKSSHNDFDFNCIIPEPKCLADIATTNNNTFRLQALAYAFSKGQRIPETAMKAAIKQAYPQIKELATTPSLETGALREPYTLSKHDIAVLTRTANITDYQITSDMFAIFHPNNSADPYADYAESIKRAIFEHGTFNPLTWRKAHWGTTANSKLATVFTVDKYIFWQTDNTPVPDIVAAIHEQTGLPMYYICGNTTNITSFAEERLYNQQCVTFYRTKNARQRFQLALFAEAIDKDSYRFTPSGMVISRLDSRWNTTEELIPKATLERQFRNI